VLSETSEALLNSVDMASLVKVLTDTLPRFEIPSAYLCLYDHGADAPETAKLLLAYDRLGPANGSVSEESVRLWDLIPGAIGPRDRRWTVIVEPLFVANQQLGFVLFEAGPREGIIYESLREQISSAINGVRLVEQVVRDAEGRLHGQKLEAIGTLASGVAHELNTPIQYVGDSVTFLVDALGGYRRVLDGYRRLLGESAEARALEETEDVGYLSEEAPRAGDRSLEGLRRAAAIVAAMKEFSRKDAREQSPADLNRALSNTLEVGRSEYRDWADVDLRLGEIPLVRCYIGEVNQVFLNLIVNAAHAIEDVVKKTGKRGTVTARSMLAGDEVVIEIADTGGGIPPEIRGKIFEPFFTTKRIGRGTGQGLAIARSAIVDKHGGTLTFTSEPGLGTIFRVSLPVHGKTQSA
jgi:signal transduction histidine kinase